jgi:hypothetical protein
VALERNKPKNLLQIAMAPSCCSGKTQGKTKEAFAFCNTFHLLLAKTEENGMAWFKQKKLHA